MFIQPVKHEDVGLGGAVKIWWLVMVVVGRGYIILERGRFGLL